jgi:hypothetical protein
MLLASIKVLMKAVIFICPVSINVCFTFKKTLSNLDLKPFSNSDFNVPNVILREKF